MSNKPFKIIISIIVVLLLFVIAIHITPSGTIRFYLALHGHPIDAVKSSIRQGGFFKRSWAAPQAYGWQFTSNGNNTYFFYLNKNFLGLWTVTSVGTGP